MYTQYMNYASITSSSFYYSEVSVWTMVIYMQYSVYKTGLVTDRLKLRCESRLIDSIL